jgi:hypothetical protein
LILLVVSSSDLDDFHIVAHRRQRNFTVAQTQRVIAKHLTPPAV